MKKRFWSWSGSLSLSLVLILTNTVWAADPFRTNNPRQIDDKTEAAFDALFHQGNYKTAKNYLMEAEKNGNTDPLAYALRASLAYIEEDYSTVKTYADKTLESAIKLKNKDPLRSNIYTGVGYFMQGSYVFKTEGPIQAISKLQQVFQYLEVAETISPNDPELNLIKGYLELLLAVNLPFSSPEKAIDRFQKYGAPTYLVDRGVAMAYRDLKQYDKSLEYLDKAISESPDNPELQYFKGQVLRNKGLKTQNLATLQESIPYFEKANQKREQLPKALLIPLDHDHQAAVNEIKQMQQNGKSS